jgi:hypothetical protein
MEVRLKRLARERNLLRYSQFKTAFMRTAADLNMETLDIGRRQFERWMSGRLRSLPRPAASEVLETMFGEPVDQLFTTSPDVPQAANLDQPGTDPDRIHDMMAAAAEQSRHHAAHADAVLGSHFMEQLGTDVVQLARDYMTRPPLDLFVDIAQARDQVFAHLDRTRRPDQITDLHFFAGVLSGLLSQICIDVAHWRAAADHALAAWTYANTIGHTGLAGWARGMQATVAFWDKRPKDALLAIRRGERYVTTGPLAVRSYSLAARTWSHNGDIEETVRAVRAAEEKRELCGGDAEDLHDSVGGLFRWDTTRQEMCAASAYLQLVYLRSDDLDTERLCWLADQGIVHAERALEASRVATPGARSAALETSMSLDMATAYAILGDARGARDLIAGVFELPAERHTYPLLYRLRHLRTELAKIPQRWAHELDAQLHDVTAALPGCV